MRNIVGVKQPLLLLSHVAAHHLTNKSKYQTRNSKHNSNFEQIEQLPNNRILDYDPGFISCYCNVI